MSYRPRPDLCINKAGELESTFIEIISTNNSSNAIVGCIYRHPCMSLKEFNSNYSVPLMEKLSNEMTKKIFIMGDFNVDLLKSNSYSESSTFLDHFESNNLMPQCTISDHLPQFLIISHILKPLYQVTTIFLFET